MWFFAKDSDPLEKRSKKTRTPVEKESQNSKHQENDHVHDKNKKCKHDSSPKTDEDRSA